MPAYLMTIYPRDLRQLPTERQPGEGWRNRARQQRGLILPGVTFGRSFGHNRHGISISGLRANDRHDMQADHLYP